MADFETNYSVVNRILVVEDDPAERDRLSAVLTKAGFVVEIAKEGGQAHAAVAMNKPDFIILDLILPNESGFEVCERINLNYRDPASINVEAFANREHEGILLVRKAGEHLHRLEEGVSSVSPA